jgi:general L-amino acid transport system permease protein
MPSLLNYCPMPVLAPHEPFFSFYNPRFRSLLYQLIVVGLLGFFLWYLLDNTLINMRERNIRAGFDFLFRQAGFDIGESLIAYNASDSFLHAIGVGIVNTLRIALLGCLFATIIGTVVGISRLSSNFLVRLFASIYVELVRNIPPLVHLLAWYFFLSTYLPAADKAIDFGQYIYLAQSGLKFPHPIWHPAWGYLLLSATVGVIIASVISRKLYALTVTTGKDYRSWPYTALFVLVIPAIVWQLTGAPTEATIPRWDEFGYVGGGSLSPEFLTVFLGLTIYTSVFIAEIVRSGIQAVPKGQVEAASAMGLSAVQRMRLVILPQALRVIIPPMTNQFLNLTKNSSLGVAVGYPEIVNVLTTTQNQTGQAVECVSIIALLYLSISLLTSLIMNWYNAKMAYKSR